MEINNCNKGIEFRRKCENMLVDVVKYYKDNKKKIPELAIIQGDFNQVYTNYLIDTFSNKGIRVNLYRTGMNAELVAQTNCKDALNKKYIIFLDGVRHYKFMDTWEYESDINEELGCSSLNRLYYTPSKDTLLPYKAAAVFQLLHDYGINTSYKNISIIGFGFDTLSLAIILSKEGSTVSIVHPHKGDDAFDARSSDIVICNIMSCGFINRSKDSSCTNVSPFTILDTIYVQDIKEKSIVSEFDSSIRREYEKGMIIYNFIRKLHNRAICDSDKDLENYLNQLYSGILKNIE